MFIFFVFRLKNMIVRQNATERVTTRSLSRTSNVKQHDCLYQPPCEKPYAQQPLLPRRNPAAIGSSSSHGSSPLSASGSSLRAINSSSPNVNASVSSSRLVSSPLHNLFAAQSLSGRCICGCVFDELRKDIT